MELKDKLQRLREEIQNSARNTTFDSNLIVNDDDKFFDDLSFDSLEFTFLINTTEELFNIKLPDNGDLYHSMTVNDYICYVVKEYATQVL